MTPSVLAFLGETHGVTFLSFFSPHVSTKIAQLGMENCTPRFVDVSHEIMTLDWSLCWYFTLL